MLLRELPGALRGDLRGDLRKERRSDLHGELCRELPRKPPRKRFRELVPTLCAMLGVLLGLSAASADETWTCATTVVPAAADGAPLAAGAVLPLERFGRAHLLNAVFLGLYQPRPGARWPGNLKRYRLDPADGRLLDVDGRAAVDPATGTLAATARSYWSAAVDGADVETGGAAAHLPPPDARNVYTYLGTGRLTAAENEVITENAALDDGLLGVGPETPSRAAVIDYVRGWSVGHEETGDVTPSMDAMHSEDAVRSEGAADITPSNAHEDAARAPGRRMGAAFTAPAAVAYGASIEDVVVYAVTNDGFLHAVDAATGMELWSFVPPELLPLQVKQLMDDAPAGELYGIDGTLRVSTVAAGGTAGAGARAADTHLYFGLGRGGPAYYALDVTHPRDPRVLWRLDPERLPGLGDSWSAPVPARIDVAGSGQSEDRRVLVLGGGHDPDAQRRPGGPDAVGNALYVVDAGNGRLLWHGSAAGGDAVFAAMRHAIPAEVRVVDLSGDGLADRMYAADLGGQVWRFDIFNGRSAERLIAGNVLASLGSATPDAPSSDVRRFHAGPDVALAAGPGGTFIHIGIGSGNWIRPYSRASHDHFYALRDHLPFAQLEQLEHDRRVPVRDADLVDVTEDATARVPHAAPGWRLELRRGGWQGEKVLSEARTFDDKVLFTTFTPSADADPEACDPVPLWGTTRLYVMDLHHGAPALSWLDDTEVADGLEPPTDEARVPAPEDRYRELAGVAPGQVSFVFPPIEDTGDCGVGERCALRPLACVGFACFVTGFESRPVRTYWSEYGRED